MLFDIFDKNIKNFISNKSFDELTQRIELNIHLKDKKLIL